MSRLNAWQRLATVASVIWIIAIAFYEYDKHYRWMSEAARISLQLCEQTVGRAGCYDQYMRTVTEYDRGSAWANAFGYAGLTWLTITLCLWGTLATIRWVLAGKK